MDAVIYTLGLISVVSLFVTIWHFFLLFGSVASLIMATNSAGLDRPGEYLASGGFLSMLRVLLYRRNKNARAALARNAARLLGAFALTFGAVLLFISLNTEYCAISMAQRLSDGTVTQICD